jgi:hypothetical protein
MMEARAARRAHPRLLTAETIALRREISVSPRVPGQFRESRCARFFRPVLCRLSFVGERSRLQARELEYRVVAANPLVEIEAPRVQRQ